MKEREMSLNLNKGGSLSLTKAAPQMTEMVFGAGWDKPANGKADLDLTVIALGADGKCRSEDDFIYFGATKDKDGNPVDAKVLGALPRNKAGTIVSTGDNRTGEGDGDDEQIRVHLSTLDTGITKLIAVLTRTSEDGQAQIALGDVPNASVRALNAEGEVELAKFNVAGNPDAKSLTLAEVTREADGSFTFKAVGEYSSDDLGVLMAKYGVA